MAISIITSSNVCMVNEVTRVRITIQDGTVDPPVNTDPYRLTVNAVDIGGTTLFQDMWPTPSNRLVRSGIGQFYLDIGPATGELNGLHGIGSGTLSIKTASPQQGAAWPTTGTIKVDFDSLQETLTYTAVSITNGVGTLTLTTPTTKAHANGIVLTGPNTLTDYAKEFILDWQTEMSAGGNRTNSLEKVKVISAKTASLLPELRVLIDKSTKFVDTKHQCFLGFTEGNLVGYLEGGLQNINAYQPSLTFTMENFPFEYKQILLDASLITGVMSQELYAIDTDVPSYNDQGTSFVITHQPQLASFFNRLTQRLDKVIPQMKLQLLQPGSLHTQMGPNFRLTQLMQAAPSGSLFRGVFFKG